MNQIIEMISLKCAKSGLEYIGSIYFENIYSIIGIVLNSAILLPSRLFTSLR